MKTSWRGASAAALSILILSACGGGGGGGGSPAPVVPPPVVKEPDPVAAIQASSTQIYAGESVQLIAAPYAGTASYRWSFTDGSFAEGYTVEHRFASVGTYTATVTATNGVGVTATSSVQIAAKAAPALSSHTALRLEGDCADLYCGLNADGSYSGSGTGLWRFRNTGTTPVVLDLDIPHVNAGQQVSLVFSHVSREAAVSLPGIGALPTAAPPQGPLSDDGLSHQAPDPHARTLALNAQLRWQERHVPSQVPAVAPERRPLADQVEVGATRTWYDLHDDGSKAVGYEAVVQSVCKAANGRRLVFWVDKVMRDKGRISDANVEPLRKGFCDDLGGFSRTVALLGDVWGDKAAMKPWYIQDKPGALQDVNIAILDVPESATSTWAGYFWGLNNSMRSRGTFYANSNEALVFFVRASGLTSDPVFYTSTLVHELTHMVNYYQRWVSKSQDHDTWLEETSAMMTEDLLASFITPGRNKIVDGRLPAYLRTGGGDSLLDWADQATSNYGMGGSLGAFLNRRHGAGLAKALLEGCAEGDAYFSSYLCLDKILKERGSEGIEDEWVRLGVTVFGGMPGRHAPQGFGFPRLERDGYTLSAADTQRQASSRGKVDFSTLKTFGPMSHVHLSDTVPAGSTRYQRKGVSVPAGSVLSVVVR